MIDSNCLCVVVLIAIIVLIAPLPAQAWTPRPCRTGLLQGQSMEIITQCMEEGIQVTWRPKSGTESEVELVQIEYRCTTHTSDSTDNETSTYTDVTILQPNSFIISGSRMIPMSLASGTEIHCIVSGCSVEGWFLDVFAVSPVSVTCGSENTSVSSATSTSSDVDSPTSANADSPTSVDADSSTMASANADSPTSSDVDSPTNANADSPTSVDADSSTMASANADSPTSANDVAPTSATMNGVAPTSASNAESFANADSSMTMSANIITRTSHITDTSARNPPVTSASYNAVHHVTVLSSSMVTSSYPTAHKDNQFVITPTLTTTVHTAIMDVMHTSIHHASSTHSEKESTQSGTPATLSVEATPYLMPTVLIKDVDNDLKFNVLNNATPMVVLTILGVLIIAIIVLFALMLCAWFLLERRYHFNQVMDKVQHKDSVSHLPTFTTYKKTCVA